MGGLAAGGSLSQSAVNEGAGARSEAGADRRGRARLVTVLFLTPLFKDLPEAVLAALIIHAVSHLWRWARSGATGPSDGSSSGSVSRTLAGVVSSTCFRGC